MHNATESQALVSSINLRAGFDPLVHRALAKWPGVPACYGWLALDRRGRWLIQGEPIRHAGAVRFLNRHYACDERGCWYVQNGPQAAFVDLALAPWVYHLTGDGRLATHTGLIATAIDSLVLDDDGNLLLVTGLGCGILLDRDLEAFTADLEPGAGAAGPPAEALAQLLASADAALGSVFWQGHELSIARVASSELPRRYGFVSKPSPSLRQAGAVP